MAITLLLVVLGSMAPGGLAVAMTSRTALQYSTASPKTTSPAMPVTVQRNPLRKVFTWSKNPKYKPFTASVSTTRTEAMFAPVVAPRNTYMTTDPQAANVVSSRTMFDREPQATSDAASYRALVKGDGKSWCCKPGKKPCKCPPKSPCKAFTEMPASPHKRALDRIDDVMEINASSPNTERGLGRRTADEAEQTVTAARACKGGGCHSRTLTTTGTNSDGRPVVSRTVGQVVDVTFPTIAVQIHPKHGMVYPSIAPPTLQASSALPEPGFVAVPALAAGHFRSAPQESQATATSSVVSAPGASTADSSMAMATRGVFFHPHLPLPIPRVKTTTTTTTTTTATTTITVSNPFPPLPPPPKVISCTTCCHHGHCHHPWGGRPWGRSPRLAARGLEFSPTSPATVRYASATTSPLSSSSSTWPNTMYRARASSEGSLLSDSPSPSTSARPRRTTTVYSTSWTETTVTTTVPRTRAAVGTVRAVSRLASAASGERSTAVAKVPAPISGAGAVGVHVGLFALLGALCMVVVA